MLTLKTDDGSVVRREYCAFIENEAQLQQFVSEVRKEIQEHGIVMCEIWTFVAQPVYHYLKLPSKKCEAAVTEAA